MKSFLVITITCPDRPGIVERVTDVVVAHSGNWEESRLARLGGDFAGIVMVSVPPDRADELTTALLSLTHDEMTVAVKRASPLVPAMREGHVLCVLRLGGADHEGIVHDVSAYLAKHGINVESMETEIVAAPMSAAPLFHMEAQLDVPPSLTIDALRENLRLIGDQLGVGIEIAAPRDAPRS
jgi:glycine cleavage system regulatory protein